MTAHNLKISSLISVLKKYQSYCDYVDARIADELTIIFSASQFKPEDNQPLLPPPNEEEDGDIDVNRLIV